MRDCTDCRSLALQFASIFESGKGIKVQRVENYFFADRRWGVFLAVKDLKNIPPLAKEIIEIVHKVGLPLELDQRQLMADEDCALKVFPNDPSAS